MTMQNEYNNHQQHTTHVRWKIFALLFLLVVINLIDRISLSIGMPTIAKEFNLSVAMQGVILSSFFWPYTLLQIPTGWLIDKFGSRKIITVSTLLWGIFQTLAAITTNGLSLLISRVALGGAEAPLFPAGAKLNSIWLASAERGRGAVIMDCGGPLGAALGGLIIAHLIILLGSWRWVFAIAGATTIILSFIAWYYLRDNPQQHPAINEAEIAKIHCGNLTEITKTLTPSNQRSDIASHTLAAILAGRAAWAMIFFGLLTWGPTYLAVARHLNLIAIGNATFFIFMAGVIGSLSGGFLMDLLVKLTFPQALVLKSLLLISGLITLLAFLALPALHNIWLAVSVLSIAAFFLMWGSLYWSLPPLLVVKEKVGVIAGIMNMAGSIGGISVPIIVGLLLQINGQYKIVLWFFALCSVIYMSGSFLITLDPREKNHVHRLNY